MTTRLLLLSFGLLSLLGCARNATLKSAPQQTQVPAPPPVAEKACLGPVPEAANAPLSITEVNDQINDSRWQQCIITNAAALRYFKELRARKYIK